MSPRALIALACLCLAPALRPAPARAAEPLVEKTDLFEAGKGGYALYRIPGIVVTAKGTLLAYCEARKSGGGDWGQIDVMMRRSTDGGKTWDAPRKIVTPPAGLEKNPVAVAQKLGEEGKFTMNNPVAIADPETGAVHFLYCAEYARCFYMRSDDDGQTFSEPAEITGAFEKLRPEYDWKVIATGPGHGIRLDNGRLLVAVWMSTGTGGHAHRPSAVSTVYSDDGGKTWKGGEIVVRHPDLKNPSETVPVQLADGRVMLNIRHEGAPAGGGSEKGRAMSRAVSVGPDGATGWGKVRLDEALPESVCMASIVRLPKRAEGERGRLLFANPHNPEERKRKNLTVKLSYDDGETWALAKALEPGPSAYSDLAAGSDGTVYCLYERGEKSPYRSLCLARFNVEWLTGRKDGPAEGARR